VLYPLFLKLSGAAVLVVGAGPIAAHKIRSLLRCGARVTVVAPRVSREVEALSEDALVSLERRAFRDEDVDGKRLVVASTNDVGVNEHVMRRCRALGVLVNVVDDPDRCDFFVPAVVDRGRVQVAISTGGASPALARRIKQDIDAALEPTLGVYAELMAWARERIRQHVRSAYEARKRANEAVLACPAREMIAKGDERGARQAVERVLAEIRESEESG
jgi:siroheme synthase-like protein